MNIRIKKFNSDKLEEQVKQLMQDDDVTKKIWYILLFNNW